MRVKLYRADAGRNWKAGDIVEVDHVLGMKMVCGGEAEGVEYDAPTGPAAIVGSHGVEEPEEKPTTVRVIIDDKAETD